MFTHKDAMWLDIVCWEKLAEQVNEQTAKGAQVEVRGRLTQESWKDKEGHPRRSFKVVAEHVSVLQSKKADLDATDEHDPLGNLEDHPMVFSNKPRWHCLARESTGWAQAGEADP